MTNQSLPDNDSFCLLPWVHQMVRGDGKLKLCCVSTGPVGDFTDMEADWNNSTIRTIRAGMVAGRPVSHCEDCTHQERFGNHSFRLRANTRWATPEIIERVNRSIQNDYHVDHQPKYLDIRFGNLCNLVCKMCHPSNSTQIEKDQLALRAIDPQGFGEFVGEIESTFGYDGVVTEAQWEMFDRYIPHITELYLAGGEPTLSKDNIRLLERCVELGRSQFVSVTINTNITNVNTKLLNMLAQFHQINIIASLDGVDRIQEYIRYPSKWSALDKNLRRIAQWIAENSSRTLTVATTVQVYNVLDLPLILDRFLAIREEYSMKRFQIEITNLTRPHLLSVEHTTAFVKALAHGRLLEWWDRVDRRRWFTNHGAGIDALLTRLKSSTGTDRSAEFLQYSKFVDQNKTAKLETHLPELYRFLTRWT